MSEYFNLMIKVSEKGYKFMNNQRKNKIRKASYDKVKNDTPRIGEN